MADHMTILFRPKAALNYQSWKIETSVCVSVCPSQIFDGFVHIRFWRYLASQAQKLKKILCILKILFDSSGKKLTDWEETSGDSEILKRRMCIKKWSIQWTNLVAITPKKDCFVFPALRKVFGKNSCFKLFVWVRRKAFKNVDLTPS